jgi:bud site selection protein 20
MSNTRRQKQHKALARGKFETRHFDQVWEDVRKVASQVHEPGKTGPMGTTAKWVIQGVLYLSLLRPSVILSGFAPFGCRAELDEDVPGYGKHYCIPCGRYYQDAASLVDHEKGKPHKKRCVAKTNQASHF